MYSYLIAAMLLFLTSIGSYSIQCQGMMHLANAIRSKIRTSQLRLSSSTTSEIEVFGKRIWIKRDDLLKCDGVNGNKARKLRFLMDRLRYTSSPTTVVSYGGIQSNAMSAIARICYRYKTEFIYFTKQIPNAVKNQSANNGNERTAETASNYEIALSCGMKTIEVSKAEYDTLSNSSNQENEHVQKLLLDHWHNSGTSSTSLLFIPQGAAMKEAESGIIELIDELWEHMTTNLNNRPWKIVIASGTGTIALFAARRLFYLNEKAKSTRIADHTLQAEIIAVPCVGSAADLMHQMRQLDANSGELGIFPSVLSTIEGKAHVFAKPSMSHALIWNQLRADSGIDSFDLIYAPRAFEILLSNSFDININQQPRSSCNSSASTSYSAASDRLVSLLDPNLDDWNVIYYHCGGDEGNHSQLRRYKYNGIQI